MPPKFPQVTPSEVAASHAAGERQLRRHQAMPTYKELAGVFGERGLDRDAAGKVQGYRFPKPRSEAERLRQNHAYLEMSQRARRIEVEDGAIRNAATPGVTLKDGSGRRHVVPEKHAERIARRKGLLPVKPKLRPNVFADADGILVVEGSRIGHTHLGTPWPWQKASCPGCR